MQKFLVKITLTILPLIIVLVLVNYFGDSAKLFDNNHEKKLASIVNSNHNLTNISNYDERLFQKEIINGRDTVADIVVIGSSRTMLINSDLFPGKSLINNSVSGATIEDLVAIYHLYKLKDRLPEKIIIGLDPWTFNDNNKLERWKSLSKEYHAFHDSLVETDKYFKYHQLYSLSYFQSSIKSLITQIKEGDEPMATDEIYNVTNTIHPDGSLTYAEAFRNASPKEIESKIISYLDGDIYGIENYKTISLKVKQELELLIEDMHTHGIEVMFFLSPYHPRVYQFLKAHYSAIDQAEFYINTFASTRNIKVLGSFDPDRVDLGENDFYDAMHVREGGIKVIVTSSNCAY